MHPRELNHNNTRVRRENRRKKAKEARVYMKTESKVKRSEETEIEEGSKKKMRDLLHDGRRGDKRTKEKRRRRGKKSKIA